VRGTRQKGIGAILEALDIDFQQIDMVKAVRRHTSTKGTTVLRYCCWWAPQRHALPRSPCSIKMHGGSPVADGAIFDIRT
jgi:hypothetical protein